VKVGDLLINKSGHFFLVIARNKTKKPWRRKIHVYSAELGVIVIPWKSAIFALQEVI